MTHNSFGGKWTDEKLTVLSEYLRQYRVIMKNTNFETWYIDAFAGTGMIEKKENKPMPLFGEADQDIVTQYRKGSVTKALELENPFDHYLFIEKDPNCFSELKQTVLDLNKPNVETICGDANEKIIQWLDRFSSRSRRAVLFLDPYGMAVDWSTMERIAKSRIIDTWILFPLGSGVNRMLKKNGEIPDNWQQKLDKFFGTHDWYDKFYEPNKQMSLIEDFQTKSKVVNEEKIGYYFYERLSTIFVEVSKSIGIMKNEKSSNLFLLFFAASNKSGAGPAIRISTYLINKRFSYVYKIED